MFQIKMLPKGNQQDQGTSTGSLVPIIKDPDAHRLYHTQSPGATYIPETRDYSTLDTYYMLSSVLGAGKAKAQSLVP